MQLLRGLAAAMIVTGHAQSMAGHMAADRGIGFVRWTGLPWGGSVDLFFVISGFIMVHASRALFGRPGAWRDFAVRRIARVVPFYWLTTTLYLAVLALAAARGGDAMPTAGHIAASYLFLPHPAAGRIFPVFELGWTLDYEMAFYLLFAVALAAGRRPASVIAMLAIGIVGAVAIGASIRPETPALLFWTRPILIDFGLGALVGALRLSGKTLPFPARVAAVVAGATLFCADPAGVFAGPLGATVDNGWPRVLLAGVPLALLMAGLLLGPQGRQPAWLRPGILIGDASYSLYLLHPFVLIVAEKLAQKSAIVAALPLPLLVIATVLAAIALALLSYRWVERPLGAAAAMALVIRPHPGPAVRAAAAVGDVR